MSIINDDGARSLVALTSLMEIARARAHYRKEKISRVCSRIASKVLAYSHSITAHKITFRFGLLSQTLVVVTLSKILQRALSLYQSDAQRDGKNVCCVFAKVRRRRRREKRLKSTSRLSVASLSSMSSPPTCVASLLSSRARARHERTNSNQKLSLKNCFFFLKKRDNFARKPLAKRDSRQYSIETTRKLQLNSDQWPRRRQ